MAAPSALVSKSFSQYTQPCVCICMFLSLSLAIITCINYSLDHYTYTFVGYSHPPSREIPIRTKYKLNVPLCRDSFVLFSRPYKIFTCTLVRGEAIEIYS